MGGELSRRDLLKAVAASACTALVPVATEPVYCLDLEGAGVELSQWPARTEPEDYLSPKLLSADDRHWSKTTIHPEVVRAINGWSRHGAELVDDLREQFQ